MLFLRRGVPGLVCGLFGGALLAVPFGNLSLGLVVGAILGTAYTFARIPRGSNQRFCRAWL